MAFPITEPIIRFLIAVPSSLLLGAMFHSMMYEDGWTVFGLVCGLLLVSCIIEIIYHFDFKSLFAHKRQLLISAVFVGVVFAVFRFDLFGYDRYLPATEKLEPVASSTRPNAPRCKHLATCHNARRFHK